MLEYIIVITNNDENDPDQTRECFELMRKLTDFVNDHTIHTARHYVHDTSLPSDETITQGQQLP